MKECTVAGCDKTQQYLKRGMCNNHYERWRRNGDPTVDGHAKRWEKPQDAPEPTEKACSKCGEVKPLSQFYKRTKPFLWYYIKCKDCLNMERKAKRIQDRLDNPPPPRTPVDHGECSFNGCTGKAEVRLNGGPDGFYCKAHYQQWYHNKALRPLRRRVASYINEDFRRCTACEKVKTHDDFHNRTGGGKQGQCRDCYYLVVRSNALKKQGRLQEALRLAERLPENIRKRYVDRIIEAINEAGRGEEIQ